MAELQRILATIKRAADRSRLRGVERQRDIASVLSHRTPSDADAANEPRALRPESS